jgi:hypothetical protein
MVTGFSFGYRLFSSEDVTYSELVTEQQQYRVIDKHGAAELREYAPCVVADVLVDGDVQEATSAAFRPLFNYISGANKASTSLAMTAPVLQEEAAPHSWSVSFVLPGDRPLQDYPIPADPKVTLRAIPAHDAAALGWSGRWTAGNIEQRTHELRMLIRDAGWEVTGEPRWARFDPPWTPPFMRRNEIVIPVRLPKN